MGTIKIHRNNVNISMAQSFFAFIYCCVLIVVILMLGNFWPNSIVQTHVPVLKKVPHKNYFLDVTKLKHIGLVINTTNCQVPNFNPWDHSIVRYMKKSSKLNCSKHHNWTYMDGNELKVNTKQIKDDGFVFRTVKCCYKPVHRVKQSSKSYTRSADRKNKYSKCIPIREKSATKIKDEFIVVECSWIKNISANKSAIANNQPTKVVYREFHAIFRVGVSIKTHKKIQFWKKNTRTSNKRPPNILIIGMDATSRLNFRRQMNKTRKILEDMDAVEILGYTKVGENTFPNFVPIFFGYSVEELTQICWFNTSIKLDDCPSIWKRLDEANFLTAHTEDVPKSSAFNYLKTGFVEQPVDFYPRPLFLAASENNATEHCIGHQTNDEAITGYIENAMDLAERNKVPIFSFSWSTGLSHDNINSIQLADDTYFQLIKRLRKKGYLDNTILIVMGDHGFRYGSVRNTLIGYYEDKLPNMWIRIPSRIKKMFPKWQEALDINSRQLTSPFTLYWTINFVLDVFTDTSVPNNSVDFKTRQTMVREHQQNFFEAVPENNTCKDVGVPEIYCGCFKINNVHLNDYILMEAALESVRRINKNLTRQCHYLKLDQITAGAVLDKTAAEGYPKLRYIVGFTTLPGGYLFEAEINYFPQNNSFSLDYQVQRASKIDKTHVKCIKDAKLELFCYCNS